MKELSKLYMVTYDRASGGIRDSVTEYYRATDIWDAVTIMDLDQTVVRGCLEDLGVIGEEDIVTVCGEFDDDIAGGGDYIYYDLRIEKLTGQDIGTDFGIVWPTSSVNERMPMTELEYHKIATKDIRYRDFIALLPKEDRDYIHSLNEEERMFFFVEYDDIIRKEILSRLRITKEDAKRIFDKALSQQ